MVGVSWLKIAEHTVRMCQFYPKQGPQSPQEQHIFADGFGPAGEQAGLNMPWVHEIGQI
jgi:hypothetical protein